MGTVAFVNAKVFYAGLNVSGQLNHVTLDYSAESLDETVFGNTTRTRKGGLKTSRAALRGFWDPTSVATNRVAETLACQIGSHNQENANPSSLGDGTAFVVMVFPEEITEGSTSTGSGHMFKSLAARYTLGAEVGGLTPFTFDAEGRGAVAGE